MNRRREPFLVNQSRNRRVAPGRFVASYSTEASSFWVNSGTRLDPSAPVTPCPGTSGKELDEAGGLFGEDPSVVGKDGVLR